MNLITKISNMDVTVNIRGNAQGLRDELENVTPDQPTTPTPTPGRTPDDSRPPTLPTERPTY